jgi:SAM-dependent methyltransferase
MSFHSDYAYALIDSTGKPKPNWRERVVCPSCELNNRMRAAIQFFQESCQPDQKSKIYLTEQTTPLFAWFKLHYSGSVGSEYLGDSIAFGGTDQRGIRNESLTRLTFPDASFDFLMSFDVFEHIPDYQAAFRECYRVLKPGGAMIFTVPFVHDAAAHTVRARLLPNGEVQHVLPAEYHGDPLAQAGCLCYYHFGWDMLEDLRQIGFDAAAAHFYWSEELGYLGIDQLLFMAKRGNS